jgi:hypothetical protein
MQQQQQAHPPISSKAFLVQRLNMAVSLMPMDDVTPNWDCLLRKFSVLI